MIRAVLAVVLTVALLGASLPVIDDARRDHADSAIRTELDQFERAAGSLLQEDDPTAENGGARRLVTLSVPTRSWTDARIDAVKIAASPEGAGASTKWTFARGSERGRWLSNVPIRTPDDDPIVLESTGRHRLVLTLDGSHESPVVTVRRFTNDDGASGSHATVALDGN